MRKEVETSDRQVTYLFIGHLIVIDVYSSSSSSSVGRLDRPLLKCSTHLGDDLCDCKSPSKALVKPYVSAVVQKSPFTKRAILGEMSGCVVS